MNALAWTRHAAPPAGIVVCIPVCNEAGHIARCLDSFVAQDPPVPFALVLLLNNCTDGTAGLVRRFVPPAHMRLHLERCWFPPHLANAGTARRAAMRIARALAGMHGVLMCTDADAAVPPDWIRRNMECIAAGADAVAGRIAMDPADAALLPGRMHEDEAVAQVLTALLDEIDDRIDPDPADPWPRHAEHSGASIAVTCAAFDAAGGIPRIASSEDRAFFAALRRIDARIRHAADIVVTVSGRLDGRAPGGMAETLRRRLAAPDLLMDECIESAADHLRRAALRAAVRHVHGMTRSAAPDGAQVAVVAHRLDLPPVELARLAGAGSFGAMWQALEAHRPILRRRRVPAAMAAHEIAAARSILQDAAHGTCATNRPSWSSAPPGLPERPPRPERGEAGRLRYASGTNGGGYEGAAGN